MGWVRMRTMRTHLFSFVRSLLTAACCLAMLMCVGCSGSFNKKFETAKAMPIPASDPLVGAWEGSWEGTDGHTGPLRAIVTPAGADAYKVQFHAGYMNLFTHQSTVTFTGQKVGNKFGFSGTTADLGWLAGGTYTYAGTITPMRFHSTYDAKSHKGVYEMTRPEGVDPFAAP